MGNAKFITNSLMETEHQRGRWQQTEEAAGEEMSAPSEDSIASLFERVAKNHPSKIAIVNGNVSLTYDSLNKQANRIARHLHTLGVRPDSFVAIYLDRSPEMLIAILAALKAGGAYLPIDPKYPPVRVLEMLEDARPVAIVTTESLVAVLSEQISQLQTSIIRVEDVLFESSTDEENPLPAAGVDDLAYMIYTSGSTGKPKGVMVTHRNVIRLLQQTEAWFQFGEDDVWTLFHSIAFDFSVWEIWGCLLTGGRLIIVPFEVSRSPRDFYELLAAEKVTVLNQTPSAFSMLIQIESDTAVMPLSLRYVIFGGEALQYRKLSPWFQRHGDVLPQLINMYGITETTVHVTYRAIKSEEAEQSQESLIGKPIPDMQIYLLDASGKPVPTGEVGEIYVGGGGVARGYHNRPQLNKDRFIPDPFSKIAGARLYRAGDLARIRPDGEMVYLGRNDSQVKINGFRIELGEVEAALAEVPGVVQSCVIARKGGDGAHRLAAYFVAGDDLTLTPQMLGRFFVERMPAHMRPSSYTRLDKLPLTVNGKLDIAALPLPMQGVDVSGQEVNASQSLSDYEERVAKIFSEALDLPRIGLDDNFFDCGGTSLLLIKAHLRIQAQFERVIPITLMFECPTVRSLAARLSVNKASTSAITAVQEKAKKTRDAFARARAAKSVVS
jgi:amino acid adenylation domain-containing protein